MATHLQREIAQAVRAYAHRQRLAETLPGLESVLQNCMNYLETDTLVGYHWKVRRTNGRLEYEPLPDIDPNQLYLPAFEHLAQALEEEKAKKG